MAFDRTALMERVAPRLHLHGYHPSDIAMLYAIARFENQQKRKMLTEKNVPTDSPAWHITYCRAGAPRLAFERGISVSKARASLALVEHDGLIDVIRRGPWTAPLRRINTEAIGILLRAGDTRLLYDQVKKNNKFKLGPLDWITPEVTDTLYPWKQYLRKEDLTGPVGLTDAETELLHERPLKLYFTSTFYRDTSYLAALTRSGPEFKYERGSEKPGNQRASRALPYLIARHPSGNGQMHIDGQPEADCLEESEFEGSVDGEEIGDDAND